MTISFGLGYSGFVDNAKANSVGQTSNEGVVQNKSTNVKNSNNDYYLAQGSVTTLNSKKNSSKNDLDLKKDRDSVQSVGSNTDKQNYLSKSNSHDLVNDNPNQIRINNSETTISSGKTYNAKTTSAYQSNNNYKKVNYLEPQKVKTNRRGTTKTNGKVSNHLFYSPSKPANISTPTIKYDNSPKDNTSRNKIDSTKGNVYVNKDNFKDYFVQNGSTKGNYNQETGDQKLTTGPWQSGNIAFKGGIDVTHDFELDGAINLGKVSTVKNWKGMADGIGIVFYKGKRNQVGGTGGNLGIYGVTNAFGWEIDTWYNPSNHGNGTTQDLQGDYDDGFTNPYGAMITTDKNGYGTIDKDSERNLPSSIEDGKFHNIKIIYTAKTKEFKVVLSTPTGDVTFQRLFDYDVTDPVYYFTIAASTGQLPTEQSFRIDSMKYAPIQKATINYVDDNTGKVLSTDSTSGYGGTPINYSTKNEINFYLSKGYRLVSDNFINGEKYDNDDTVDQVFTVHLRHDDLQGSENKKVKEIIHYQYENGKKAHDDYTSELDFNRNVVTDEVTGQKTYGDWKPANGTNFNAVVSPTIKGYTPDQIEIAAVTGVNENSKDIEKTVVYNPKLENAIVIYIDDNTGKELSEKELVGRYGSQDSYRTANTIKMYESAGYKLVSDNYPQTGVNYDQDGIVQRYEVHLAHQITKLTNIGSVKETIHYQYENGKKAHNDYVNKLNFKRTENVDKITGQKTYSPWEALDGTSFKAVNSPVIKGYVPDKDEIVAIVGINGDSQDIERIVVYRSNSTTPTKQYPKHLLKPKSGSKHDLVPTTKHEPKVNENSNHEPKVKEELNHEPKITIKRNLKPETYIQVDRKIPSLSNAKQNFIDVEKNKPLNTSEMKKKHLFVSPAQKNAGKLPQTNEKKSAMSYIGILILTISGLFIFMKHLKFK